MAFLAPGINQRHNIRIMIIDFSPPPDDLEHSYCINCKSESLTEIMHREKSQYYCAGCRSIYPRAIHFSPRICWWINPVTNEFWHESVGVFIFNRRSEILLFERTVFPFVWTIPAGHLEPGEIPRNAAVREVAEETGILLSQTELVTEEDVVGDSCKWGADCHRWHLFRAITDISDPIQVNAEGKSPLWLPLERALSRELTVPARYFIQRYFIK